MMKKLLLILILPLLSNGQSFEHGSFANRSERHTNTDFRKFQTNFSHDSSRDQAHLSSSVKIRDLQNPSVILLKFHDLKLKIS